MSAISKALASADRSYVAAKASVASMANEMLATTRGGLPVKRASMGDAAEQLRHFRGWVYSAVRPIAQRIAGQPIRVGVEKRPTKPRAGKSWMPENVEEVETHALLDLLNDPNELMVRWSLIFTLVASMELTGRQLWWLPKLGGRMQVMPIPTSWLERIEGSTRRTGFVIRPPGAADTETLPADECAYFCYPHPGDPHGSVSPLQAAAAAVDADEAVQTSQVATFGRSIFPKHALLVGQIRGPDGKPSGARPTLSGPQRRQLIESILQIYRGAAKDGEPLILDGLIEDVKRLSNSPAEMDWTESSEFLKKRILQTFGTNPAIVGELENANRAGTLAAEDHFCKFTVNPKIELISQCLTEWVAPMFAADGQRLVIWIQECKPRDEELWLQQWQVAIGAGAVTYDEVREHVLGLPPLPFGGDDTVGASNALGTALRAQLAQYGMGELIERSVNGRARLNGNLLS